MKKLKLIFTTLIACLTLGLASCEKADMVNHNLSQQADAFELYRQFTLVNLRSDKVLLEVEGLLSISNSANNELAVTIKTGANTFKKHYCFTGAEVCYLVEQKENATTDPYHWEIRLFWVWPDVTVG